MNEMLLDESPGVFFLLNDRMMYAMRKAYLLLCTLLFIACVSDNALDVPMPVNAVTTLPSVDEPDVSREQSPSVNVDVSCEDAESALDSGVDAADSSPSDAATDSSLPSHLPMLNHVLVVGQSNSVANGANPPVSLTQPFSNVMFSSGVMPMSNCIGNDGCTTYVKPNALVPLVEGDKYYNYVVETPSAGIANEATHRALQLGEKHDMLTTLHGRSGWTYWCLRKGGCNYKPTWVQPFAQAMLEVNDARDLARSEGLEHVVRAIAVVHGESDQQGYFAGTPEFPLSGSDGVPNKLHDYSDALVEWQADYETNVRAITKQTASVPLILSQLSGQNSTRVAVVAQMQLSAHEKATGKVVLASPAYQVSVREDCLHYDANGSRWIGEYIGKAYAQIVVGKKPWEPLRPVAIELDGLVITVKFHVPVPPLVLDTGRVTNPGSYGFEVTGTTIATVILVGNDSVKITLTSPAPANAHLIYAMNQTPGTCIGPGTVYAGGARGNLRDSDPSVSQSGNELFNWSVAFDKELN